MEVLCRGCDRTVPQDQVQRFDPDFDPDAPAGFCVDCDPGKEEDFRKPDVHCASEPGFWGVWYGPAGKDGDCATEVEYYEAGMWIVSEYQDCHGYFDELDEDFPIRKLTVTVPALHLRHAARVGTDRIAYSADREEMVESLP